MCALAISALLVFQHPVVLTLRQFRIQCAVDDQGLIASGCNTQPDYGGGDRRGGALQGVCTSSTGAEAGAAAVVQKQSTDATRTTKQCNMYVFIEETMTRAWTTPHGITVADCICLPQHPQHSTQAHSGQQLTLHPASLTICYGSSTAVRSPTGRPRQQAAPHRRPPLMPCPSSASTTTSTCPAARVPALLPLGTSGHVTW